MFLSEKIVKRQKDGLYRDLRIRNELIDFASNDYLGFARCEELFTDVLKEISSIKKIGSTGSRLLTGNSWYIETLEKEIARTASNSDTLLFTSGYGANLAIFCLASCDDTILFDEDIHASMRDGIRLSKARHFHFRHNDPEHFEMLLKKTKGRIFVAVESIYSVDGSHVNKDILSLCEKYEAYLIVDEAHAFPIFRPIKGAFVHVLTFGKALGAQGAAIVCDKITKEYLINFARPFIYTTAPSFLTLAAIKCALQMIPKTSAIEKLHHLMKSWPIESPIFAIKGKGLKTRWEKLKELGFDVSYLRYPTVKEEALRISLHSFNTKEELDQLRAYICRL